ncbi:MAG: hypothetical protein KME57_16685 [Scytonema hyalinum WJT4-NPBG1]|nr:hypothetical protein [Scytonema hyalinum WJT4-NPBG1]
MPAARRALTPVAVRAGNPPKALRATLRVSPEDRLREHEVCPFGAAVPQA